MKRLKNAAANLAIHAALWLNLYGVVVDGSVGAARLLYAWSWVLALCSALLFIALLTPVRPPRSPWFFERYLFRISTSAFIVSCIWHGEAFAAGATFAFLLMCSLVDGPEQPKTP